MNRLSLRYDFEGSTGAMLSGRLEVPVGKPSAFALFAHCFTCSKETHAAARISRALAARGVAVLRFDFTGLGGSEGDFANTDFSSNVADLVAAARALERDHQAPGLVIGHSLGGAAVLAAAGELDSVRAVATIGAPADPAHVARLFAGARDEIERDGKARVSIAGRPFTISRGFIEDIEQTRLAERIAGLGRALMVFHAPEDEVVAFENAERIFEAARQPKSFTVLDGADHLLRRREDAWYVADVIAAWVARALKLPHLLEREKPHEGMAEAEGAVVRVEETGEGRFRNAINANGHYLIADEPASVGGGDAGPGPYDFLLAGLGACTNMTVRMYARRKGWSLNRVATRLTHEKVHAEDAGAGGKARIDRITRELSLDGDLDADQRARLLEIADKCPVHRTLEAEPQIVTTLAD